MRELDLKIEAWPYTSPFVITGYTFTDSVMLVVTIKEDGFEGQGEGSGIYYTGENGESMLAQAESVRGALENGATREELQSLLPRGGARNALDCAMWDLEAKKTGRSIWKLVGITPSEQITVNTVGIGTPEEMFKIAKSLDTPKIKVKLSGEIPLERIKAVVDARPDADIIVDVNQGWTFEQLKEMAPKFKELGIAMIEQPLPRGGDEELEGYLAPLPLCADESCLDSSELEVAAKRYQMINIKLDKTGGLTEALKLASEAQALGKELMVGNMVGASRAMAPSFVVAQLCKYVDLDGALFLQSDRDHPMSYKGGTVSIPDPKLWGQLPTI